MASSGTSGSSERTAATAEVPLLRASWTNVMMVSTASATGNKPAVSLNETAKPASNTAQRSQALSRS